jgi:hypothetical protein
LKAEYHKSSPWWLLLDPEDLLVAVEKGLCGHFVQDSFQFRPPVTSYIASQIMYGKFGFNLATVSPPSFHGKYLVTSASFENVNPFKWGECSKGQLATVDRCIPDGLHVLLKFVPPWN